MCNRYSASGVGAPRGFQRPSGRCLFRMAVCYPSFSKSPATVDCKEKPADPKDHQAELPDERP